MNTISLLLGCWVGVGLILQPPDSQKVQSHAQQEQGESRHIVALRTSVSAETSDGWLGVRLATPPAALSAQLRLDGTGLLITNIVEDSPAQQCGAEKYDVIVDFAGEAVTQNVADLAERIRRLEAGKQVKMSIIRAGQTLDLNPVLESRLAHVEHSWVYDDEPDQIFRHVISLRGKVLETDPGGNVVVKDIGELENVPMPFMALVPDFKEAQVALYDDDGRLTRRITAVKDGVQIEIEQLPDQRIRVQRTEPAEDGEIHTEHVYADSDELREGDQEAYELRSSVTKLGGDAMLSEPARWVFELAPAAGRTPDLQPWIDAYETLDPGSEEQREALEELHQVLSEHLHELTAAGAWKPSKAQTEWMNQLTTQLQQLIETHVQSATHPTYQFHQLDDGRIEVTLRRRDAALIETYADAAELQSKNPGLYERYVALKASE